MLRTMVESDISKIFAIEFISQLVPWSRETFVHCLTAGYSGWVVEKDNEVVGFIILSYESGEGHILNLCVHPHFQHQGLGKQLMVHALETAKEHGAKIIYLEVRRSNVNAISLYQKMAFSQIGERKAYYPNSTGREDALVFGKDLTVDEQWQ